MSYGTFDNRQIAIKNLERIITLDPLYKPGRFFLAYTKLQEGEAEAAAEMFASITAPFNQGAKRIFQEVQEEWTRPDFRLLWIKPLVRLLRPWLELWQEIETHLNGGTLYLNAQQWSKFDQNLAEWKNTTESQKHFEDAMFRLHIDSFDESSGIQRYVKIASGLAEGDPDKAHQTLDLLLDKHAIWEFDHQLDSLESQCSTLESDEKLQKIFDRIGKPQEIADLGVREDQLPVIRALYDTPIGIILKPSLERLEKSWESQNWERCKDILRKLHVWTRKPSKFEAGLLLHRTMKLPKKTGWLIRFCLPAYTLLDRYRANYHYAYFLESEFYYALSKYRGFTRASLIESRERSFALHDQLLAGPVPADMAAHRYFELRLLARSLEADAAVRLALDENPDSERPYYTAEARLIELLKPENTWSSELLRLSTSKRLYPIVRAAIFNTLGLLERYKEHGVRYSEKKSKSKGELNYFYQALDLERSPDTCFYIAESLNGRGQVVDAERYLAEALRLCPKHPGALLLRQTLSASAATT